MIAECQLRSSGRSNGVIALRSYKSKNETGTVRSIGPNSEQYPMGSSVGNDSAQAFKAVFSCWFHNIAAICAQDALAAACPKKSEGNSLSL
jgi:hypothetical protein